MGGGGGGGGVRMGVTPNSAKGTPLAEKISQVVFDGLPIGYIYSSLSIDNFFVPMHCTKKLQLYSVVFFSKMAFLKKRA